MIAAINNSSYLNQIYNNSNYSAQTYLQDLAQMVTLESNIYSKQDRMSKISGSSNIEMLEYQLRQKERLKSREKLLEELSRLKDEELKNHKNIVQSDIRKNVLKSIKNLKGRNKGKKFKIPSPPSFIKFPSIDSFIDGHVEHYGHPSLSLDSNSANINDGFNPASMLRNLFRGIDFMGTFRQLFNAALPLLNIGARLGLGIGTDVFGEIDDSQVYSQSLAVQNQALSRSDFVPELSHWFRRTIWFLGFSAVWTLSPSLAIITVVLALTYEGILFLVPSLQERSDNQRIDEYIGSPLSGARRQLSTNFQQNHIFHPPGLLNQQTVRLVAPIKPQRNWILSRQIKPNKLSSTYVRRKIVPLISQNVNFNIPHHKYKYFG